MKSMTKSVSALAKEFLDGFNKKIKLNSLDMIEVFDSQKRDVSDDSFAGVYGWANVDTDAPVGYSIEWKKDSHSVVDVMKEIESQLQNEFLGKIKPLKDGVHLILKRIK